MKLEKWIEGFHKDPPEILSEPDLKAVCNQVKDLLVAENNVPEVNTPVTIAGDIHGQFFDLRYLVELAGGVETKNFVFLGDFVDRGLNSVECFEYLLLLKLRYPHKVTLIRGNHETRHITRVYGFYDECVRKYGHPAPWQYCTEVFDYLSLAAVVNGRIFCVHGGLSPMVHSVDELRLISRTSEIPHHGPFGDLVWSDPDETIAGWEPNPRGAGWLFGWKVTDAFTHLNDLDLVARAHQLAMEGYQYCFKKQNLVTVWSAPNYCYRCGNVAAILQIDFDMRRQFLVFKETEQSKAAAPQRSALDDFFL